MVAKTLTLPWGKSEKLTFSLPPSWEVEAILEPQLLPALPDTEAAARQALAAPTGMSPLRELARGKERAVILVDDLSRPTPAHQLLPSVLETLESGGVGPEAITLVTTLGVHRPMTEQDLARKIGERWVKTLRWENHDHRSPEGNVKIGVTSRGTPVVINRTVAQADLVVSLGIIEPHVIASFGGGYKNLIPGAAGAATIGGTHTLNLTPQTFNMVGRPPEENPMRLDLEEGGRMLKAPFFVVNTILNRELQVVQIVSGDALAAHREGVKTCARLYGVKIPRLADVLITCSYPMDSDLRQGLKALANGIRAVRLGGLLIDLVRAEEGVGVLGMGRKKSLLGPRSLKLLAPLLLPLVKGKKVKADESEEDKFFTYFALQAVRRNRLLLYAPTIDPAFAANIPFAQFAHTLEELEARAQCLFPGKARVLVFPAGGVTYPILG